MSCRKKKKGGKLRVLALFMLDVMNPTSVHCRSAAEQQQWCVHMSVWPLLLLQQPETDLPPQIVRNSTSCGAAALNLG